MLRSIKFNFFIPIYIVIFIVSSSIFSHGKMLDGAVLNVGEELKAETLPLKMGSRVYKLQDLKSLTWYEVKISYPASIPASFSLQLKKGDLESGLNRNRRLLNTEKLIFKTDNLDSINDQTVFLIDMIEMSNQFRTAVYDKYNYIGKFNDWIVKILIYKKSYGSL
ncbi:uncharacterized protein LOC108471476 isoform X1 [Gossypium arboreum]|uniref:uncharacterized protein LOC108471476 isoform X1 n=1 Tax=Gossypium arboreum TaxID=29729 RepID=UPI0022F19FF9|nr:uncharacterized protein LOC108471476 isoform X1 [Gossypium arboreum]